MICSLHVLVAIPVGIARDRVRGCVVWGIVMGSARKAVSAELMCTIPGPPP